MQHLLTEEQVMFGAAVTRFVAQEFSSGHASGRRFSRERLQRLAGLGGLSLAIPEAFGGFGGPVEAMVMHERLAPALAPEPVIACGVHAASLIAAAGPVEMAQTLLPLLAAGEKVAVIAHLEPGQSIGHKRPQTVLRREGGGLILDGRKALVPWGMEADLLLISARDEGSGRMAWIAVDRDDPALVLSPVSRIDGLPAADLEIRNCRRPASALLDRIDAEAALWQADDLAEAAQVAEMVGLMAALVKATIDYVAVRKQFGAPLGTFQALRHRIADMWMACEETRALAFAAAMACSADASSRADAVAIAKVRACDAADRVGPEAIQMHGAIGMTDELVVSHWYKRLWALKLSLGDREARLMQLADPTRNFALA